MIDRFEPLGKQPEVDDFRCGRAEIDAWFPAKARSAGQFVSVSLAWQADQVVGFFALKSVVVQFDEPDKASARLLDRDGLATAILLAQMGVREDRHGEGLGRELFVAAARVAVEQYEATRVPFFVVDAADEDLIGYYEAMGMTRLPGQLRLVSPISAIRKGLKGGS